MVWEDQGIILTILLVDITNLIYINPNDENMQDSYYKYELRKSITESFRDFDKTNTLFVERVQKKK